MMAGIAFSSDAIAGALALKECQPYVKRAGRLLALASVILCWLVSPASAKTPMQTYVEAMRRYNAGDFERRMRSWTLPFLIRHSAFHNLDHAWEMEDKDLSAQDSA